MNTIAVANGVTNGRALGPVRQASDVLKRIGWMGYLVASYPSAKTHEFTHDVLQDQFQGISNDILFEAARLYVREGSKWFPSAFEFRPFVERVQAEAEIAQVAAAWKAVVAKRAMLRARRDDLLRAWYDGEASNGDLLALAGEMEQVGLEYAAASLRAKVRPVVARPGYAEFVAGYAEQLRDAAASNQG